MKIKAVKLDELPFKLVVAVSPHPDDSVIGCGGFLHRLTKLPEGRKPTVVMLVLTSGYHGVTDEFLRAHLMKRDFQAWPLEAGKAIAEKTNIRKAEVDGEVRRLGVDTAVFLDLRELYERHGLDPEEIAAARQALGQLSSGFAPSDPKLLLIPRADDPHPVHSLSSQLVTEAAEEIPGCEVWYYETPWMPLDPRDVTVIVKLGPEDIEAKLDGIHEHQSQLARTDFVKVVRDLAEMKAETLREILFGFGKEGVDLGEFVEAYQQRRELTLVG